MKDWIPYKLKMEDNQLLFEWLELKGKRFTEPFFEETISKCKGRNHSQKNTSTLEEFINIADPINSIPPSAFIFHVSRCGSTLLSQLLATSKNNIVLSEVPLIDHLLRLPYQTVSLPEALLEQALIATIHIMGQKRNEHESHLIIKLDSWHLFSYETLRKLYPDALFIFLYRSPDEIIRSQRKQRGMQFVPGLIEPAFTGFRSEEIASLNLDQYLEALLEKYFSRMNQLSERDTNFLLLNYQEGGISMTNSLIKKLRLSYSREEIETCINRSRFHSKHPHQNFVSERFIEKNHELKNLNRYYLLLEEKRINQP